MAFPPPADVELLHAKAHGVGGFAVRPATLFSICVWKDPYREKLSGLFCPYARSNSTTHPGVNRIFKGRGELQSASRTRRPRYERAIADAVELLGAPLSRKTVGGKMRPR